jgi:hypothetical protein
MAVLFANNYSTILAAETLVGDSTLLVATPLPFTLNAGDSCYLTLFKIDTGVETVREVVKVTGANSNTLTVVRGVDNTTAVAWVNGSKIEMRLVSAYFNDDVVTFSDIDDITSSVVKLYSSSKVQALHNAQQEALAILSGASASFGNSASIVIPEDPTAATVLTWTNKQTSSNSNIFDLGTNEVSFKKDGTYSFLNTLTFSRSGSSDQVNVTFEMYDKNTSTVLGSAVIPLNTQAGASTSLSLNVVLPIAGTTASNPIVMKVRVKASSVNGTVSLNSFDSVLITQSATAIDNKFKVDKDSDTGAALLPAGTSAQRPTGKQALFRFNTDMYRFEGHNGTAWGSLGGATGGGNDAVFYVNGQTVTADYTIPSGQNAMSAGPITIADGITVTISDGSVWTVV